MPAAGGWDDYRVETASALLKGATMHLFYCADRKQMLGRYQIGEVSLALDGRTLREALLVEGKSPKRNRATPVLAGVTDRSSFRNNVQEPSALYAHGRFELYFVGLKLSRPDEAIGGPWQSIRRVGLGRALMDGALNVIDVSDSPLVDLANIIEVKRMDDRLVLFTTLGGTGQAHQGDRIGYHTSRDGRHWSGPRELIAPLAAGFDSWGCMSPTVVQEADRWVLFYTGLEHSFERPRQRWGMSMGSNGWLFGTLGRAEAMAPGSAVVVGKP
jgi:hypothetical protein